jgi:hypothetical protein
MYKFNPENLGEFQEKTCGKWFTYKKTSNPWALSQGLDFEIDVLDGVRFATVKKTRVYVCIDESATGQPVTECWTIKKHHFFSSNQGA